LKRRHAAGERHLRKVDPVLAGLIDKHGPCTLMHEPRPHFHTLVSSIISQQLSVKAAQTIERRLLDLLGADVVTPLHFEGVRETRLRACGLSGAKARYVRELARRVRCGELDLDLLDALDDEEAAALLMGIPGIGRWTADMLLIFSLGRGDILPLGDLALCRSIRCLYGLREDASPGDYQAIAESWRPYRSLASWYCWAAVD